MFGLDRANFSQTASTALPSVVFFFKNFRLAGVFSKMFSTMMVVPSGQPASSVEITSPKRHTNTVPISSSGRLVKIRTELTAAMAASASPRKPSVPMASKSLPVFILLVAWRRMAFGTSSRAMPQPLSVMRTNDVPPSLISTVTALAPASAQFSSISLTADAGRSTTSPAAMRLAVCLSSTLMIPIKHLFPGQNAVFVTRFGISS